jgi:hypothetical protein
LPISLQNFREAFQPCLAAHPDWRPFICDGSPLSPEAFIVGINATVGVGSFWKYWDDEHGFNKLKWYADYLRERGGKPSKTRIRIEVVLASAGTTRCVETNVFAQPTRRANLINDPSTRCFESLLLKLEPRVFLLHGKAPAKYIVRRFALSEAQAQKCRVSFSEVALPWGGALVRMVTHLSTPHWNRKESLVNLGKELQNAIRESRSLLGTRENSPTFRT